MLICPSCYSTKYKNMDTGCSYVNYCIPCFDNGKKIEVVEIREVLKEFSEMISMNNNFKAYAISFIKEIESQKIEEPDIDPDEHKHELNESELMSLEPEKPKPAKTMLHSFCPYCNNSTKVIREKVEVIDKTGSIDNKANVMECSSCYRSFVLLIF